MAAFGHQMSCHGKTHHAETEKSDFSHVYNPGVSPALLAGRMLEERRRAGSVFEQVSPRMRGAQ
jgi:hypothetical protein